MLITAYYLFAPGIYVRMLRKCAWKVHTSWSEDMTVVILGIMMRTCAIGTRLFSTSRGRGGSALNRIIVCLVLVYQLTPSICIA